MIKQRKLLIDSLRMIEKGLFDLKCTKSNLHEVAPSKVRSAFLTETDILAPLGAKLARQVNELLAKLDKKLTAKKDCYNTGEGWPPKEDEKPNVEPEAPGPRPSAGARIRSM